MRGSRGGFALALLFAFLVIGAPDIVAAQDMPPVLAPLAASPTPPTAAPQPTAVAPSAEAAIPPAAPASIATPAEKPHITAAGHSPIAHHNAKFVALVRHLTTAHPHTAAHHIVVKETERSLPPRMPPGMPPGMPVPPPGYYGPGYGPGPYQRLVYAGPPPNLYEGWAGYRGRPPFYP
jgi:hypothetical protein